MKNSIKRTESVVTEALSQLVEGFGDSDTSGVEYDPDGFNPGDTLEIQDDGIRLTDSKQVVDFSASIELRKYSKMWQEWRYDVTELTIVGYDNDPEEPAPTVPVEYFQLSDADRAIIDQAIDYKVQDHTQ